MVMIEQDDITGKVFKTPQMSTSYATTPEQTQQVFAANRAAQQETIKQVTAYAKSDERWVAYARAGIDMKTGLPITQEKTVASTLDGTTVIPTLADILKGTSNSGLIILAVVVIAVIIYMVMK